MGVVIYEYTIKHPPTPNHGYAPAGGPTPINRTWLFNGNEIKGERYVFLNGGNTLVVGQSNTDDAGTYTCKAANILWSVKGNGRGQSAQ